MKIILTLLLIALASSDQFVPIPKTPYGFSFGSPDGPLHIEAFLDLLCTSPSIKVPIVAIHTTF